MTGLILTDSSIAHISNQPWLKMYFITRKMISAASGGNLSSGLPARSDIIRAVQPQKTARDLAFRI